LGYEVFGAITVGDVGNIADRRQSDVATDGALTFSAM
jgi:hypothetical protein